MSLDTHELKLLFMAVIFTATTCVGLTPMVVRALCGHRGGGVRKSTRDRFLSCASCYSAGVFLFVCFLGLLPAADSKFHHFLRELSSRDESMEEVAEFPWGFFVVTCGFLFIFTIDKVVDAAEHSRKRSSSLPSISIVSEVARRNSGIEEGSTQALESSKLNGHAHEHYHDCGDQRGHGVPSSVIFLVALGIHSVFEGMAVGLQTEREKVLEFSVAVLVHEVVMAFSFGMEVNKSRSLGCWQKLLYVLLFTMTLPLGIGAGLGLQNAPSEHREIVSAVFEALATGIFIHVIFIEVLAKEFPEHHHHDHAPKSSKESIEQFKEPSELCLILEKIASICLGLLTLILLNVFMHSHHH